MALETELMKGNLSLLILSTLAGGDQYGYEITRRIEQGTGGILSLKEGSLYPALHSLERRGLVTGYWVSQEGRPSRKYYRLTPEGVSSLAEDRERWKAFTLAVARMLEVRHA